MLVGETEGFPVLPNKPNITFRVVEDPQQRLCYPKQFAVQCNVEQNIDPGIVLDVYWYIGDKEKKRNVGENGIPYKDFPAELLEGDWVDINAQGQLDTDVR